MPVNHPCDLCGLDTPRPLPQDPRIAVCGKCGFVYVPERRSSAEIAASWGEIYSSGAYDPNWPAVKARLYYVAEWIEQNCGGWRGKTVLDIGAGKGQFMDLVTCRGANPVGIEPAEPECSGIFSCSVENAPPLTQFDIVTINWTLENCGDCLAMLRFAREHCKPDGWVVVATGSRILVPFKKPLSKYLNPAIPADLHCFRWSVQSLRTAMAKSGLKTGEVNRHEECDWLVMVAQPTQPYGLVTMWDDDPQEVIDYFHCWATVCP